MNENSILYLKTTQNVVFDRLTYRKTKQGIAQDYLYVIKL